MSTTDSDTSTTTAAKGEAQRVVGVASDEASNVAHEARTQVKNVLDDARTQLEDQSRTQLSSLKDLLLKVGDDLESMVQGADRDGLATEATRAVSDRARQLGGHLDSREPAELLEDVRDFARRRPGTFLIGALAAGVVAGRLARGAKAASSDSSASTSGTATGTGTTRSGATGGGISAVPPYNEYDEAGTSGGDPLAGPFGAAPPVADDSSVSTGSVYEDRDVEVEPFGGRHTTPPTTGDGFR